MFTDRECFRTYSSAGVYAENHNPAVLEPYVLAHIGMVPEEWNYVETTRGPEFSRIRYANGVLITLDKADFKVEDSRPHTPEGDPTLLRIVDKYLTAATTVSHRRLYTNSVWEIPMQQPGQFLTGRFLDGAYRTPEFGYLQMDPRFRFNIADWAIYLWLYPGWMPQDNGVFVETMGVGVRAACDNVGESRRAIDQWEEVQGVVGFVTSALLRGA